MLLVKSYNNQLKLVSVLTLALAAVVAAQFDPKPAFHFMAEPAGWMNDPCAPFYDSSTGLYHLFYQYNPTAAVWGDMHWGHAFSSDLVHWQHLPIALAPSQPYDAAGVWTGSATIDPATGMPVVLYTGVSGATVSSMIAHEAQCLAVPANVSDPLLAEWAKSDANPVIAAPPDNYTATAFRDPTTAFAVDDAWIVLLGSGTIDAGEGLGSVLAYRSAGLANLTRALAQLKFVDEFARATDATADGSIWECPDLFAVDGVSLLKVSSRALGCGDHLYLGVVDESAFRFVPMSHQIADYSQYYYASKSFADPATGRRIVMAWLSEGDSTASQVARGWAGCHGLPRVVRYVDDGDDAGSLVLEPLPELAILRGARVSLGATTLAPGALQSLDTLINGTQLEIHARFSAAALAAPGLAVGLDVLHANSTGEYTRVFLLSPAPAAGIVGLNLTSVTPLAMVQVAQHDASACAAACLDSALCAAWVLTGSQCSLQPQLPVWPGPACIGCVSGHKAIVGVDRTASSLAVDQQTSPNNGLLGTAARGDTIDLRVFVDHSVIEVFANGARARISSRVYPLAADAVGVRLWAEGGAVLLHSLHAWPMRGA